MADAYCEGGHEVALDFKNARQSVPTDGPENKDEFSGDTPPKGDATIGTPQDLAAVAPYTYPEHGPGTTHKTRFATDAHS